jgi:hypothetical protein
MDYGNFKISCFRKKLTDIAPLYHMEAQHICLEKLIWNVTETVILIVIICVLRSSSSLISLDQNSRLRSISTDKAKLECYSDEF